MYRLTEEQRKGIHQMANYYYRKYNEWNNSDKIDKEPTAWIASGILKTFPQIVYTLREFTKSEFYGDWKRGILNDIRQDYIARVDK
jgi:hypothetical protein